LICDKFIILLLNTVSENADVELLKFGNVTIRARANAESSTLAFLLLNSEIVSSLSLSYEAFAMSATKSASRKRASESERAKSDKNKRSAPDNFDLDLDFDLSEFVFAAFAFSFIFFGIVLTVSYIARICSDIKGIVSALHLIRDKAQKDGQKKNEETISRYLKRLRLDRT